MRVSAKADYALRAAAELAAAEGTGPVKGEQLARAQSIPPKFLENILLELRHAGLVQSQRGVEGGYWLARPAAEITLAEVIRAVEGPLANVRGARPESVESGGAAEPSDTSSSATKSPNRLPIPLISIDIGRGLSGHGSRGHVPVTVPWDS